MQNPVTDFVCSEDEAIYKKPIVLYFGGPYTERQQDLLDKRAIEWNNSFEFVFNHDFDFTINRFLQVINDEGKNYFDLNVFIYSGISDVYAPKLWPGSYLLNGHRYPKLTFEDGFLLDRKKVKRFFFKDEVIDLVGKSLEEHCEYEYIEFKREKRSTSGTKFK